MTALWQKVEDDHDTYPCVHPIYHLNLIHSLDMIMFDCIGGHNYS